MRAPILGFPTSVARVGKALGGPAMHSATVLGGVGAVLYALYLLAPPRLTGGLCGTSSPVRLDPSITGRPIPPVPDGPHPPLGWSLAQERPVVDILAEVAPQQATLLGFALVGVAAFLAIAALLRQRGHGETLVTTVALALCTAPTWLVAVVAHGLLFERYDAFHDTSVAGWWSAMVPGLAVGFAYGGIVTYVRGRTDEPLSLVLADKLPTLLSALVVEEILLRRLGGLGWLLANSVFNDDAPLLVATAFVFALLCVGLRFLAGLPRALGV